MEEDDVHIGDNVINSNNIVTKNTYIMPSTGIIEPPENPCGIIDCDWTVTEPSFMFFENNNDFEVNLDFVVQLGENNNENELRYIQLLLSEELYSQLPQNQRERIFGFDNSTAIVQIDGSSSEFRLENIPMNARERQMIGFRVALNSELEQDYRERLNNTEIAIFHEASDANVEILPSSTCHILIPPFEEIESRINSNLVENKSNSVDLEYETISIYSFFGDLLAEFDKANFSRDEIPKNALVILVYRNELGEIVKSEKTFILE